MLVSNLSDVEVICVHDPVMLAWKASFYGLFHLVRC